MDTLNIIGCGKLGQSLARLWHDSRTFTIGSVLNQSLKSAQRATPHIGAGTAIESISTLEPAKVWLIATSDAQIPHVASQLAEVVSVGDVVFHCSGALSSDALQALKNSGAACASIHPVMTFPQALETKAQFAGTYCGYEGNRAALDSLLPAFEAIGARCFPINANQKAVYHTANVMCCNYLTALTEASLQLFAQAGVDQSIAPKLMQPLMQATLKNIFEQGTTQALTGPIARGDFATVEAHCQTLEEDKQGFLEIYKSLGNVALELSRKQATASTQDLDNIEQLFQTKSH